MALLVVLLPPRPRAAAPSAPTALGTDESVAWVLSPDGLLLERQGLTPLTGLPAADTVVAVLPASDLAWHRMTCPKAPAGRLRAALAGMLEEQLLDDPEHTHLALAPGHAAGQPSWIAATHKPWLQLQLKRLADAGRPVDRVVPALAPGGTPQAQFFTTSLADGSDEAPAWLALADADQALCLPLAGGHAQALLGRALGLGTTVAATPAAAQAAERALAGPVAIRSDAELGLAALRSSWQLLQFDLAPGNRGARALGGLWQQLRSPAWRPVRWGLGALVAVQVLGLNAYAWQQQQALQTQRAAMTTLLRSAHPQVRSVLDAPAQMRRETELLRETAGVPGDADLETLLAAAAAAWPDGQGPAAQLRFEPGRLTLPASAWTPPQVEQFRQRLKTGGWTVDQADGRLTVQRGARTARP